jgi:hypothetical protein
MVMTCPTGQVIALRRRYFVILTLHGIFVDVGDESAVSIACAAVTTPGEGGWGDGGGRWRWIMGSKGN